MANITNQFYYVDQGRPILKTEYDDGSEDFYDASGQFSGYSWSNLSDGTVFDPYADMAQQEADRQQQQAQARSFQNPNRNVLNDLGNSIGYAAPGGSQMPTPFQRQNQQPDLDAPGNRPGTNNVGPGTRTVTQNPPPGGAPGAPGAPGAAPPDPRLGAQMDRYDWAGNPRQAMLNAMADVGGFQLTNNPYVDRLLAAAPGLATAFMGQRGLAGASGSSTAGSYADFGQYLQNALRSGQVFNTVSSAQGMFPQLVNAVRGYNAAGSSGAAPGSNLTDNPFIRQLASMFAANNNQGALGLYGQLFSPFMTGAQQRPFSDLMEARYTQGSRDFYNNGNMNTPGYGGNDWWRYLFGM